MKLYYSPGACSLAAHITAQEAGVAVTPVKVDLRAHKTEDGSDYYGINAKGYVPAVSLPDGGVLTEAAAVVQYLADQAPGSGLAPEAGTLERYRFQEWLTFISSELHKGFGPLWNPASSSDVKQAAKDKLATRFAYLEKALSDRDYLMGSRFTAADAYLFTILNWTNFHAVDLSGFPKLSVYVQRVAARPKVQATMQAEGLLKQAA